MKALGYEYENLATILINNDLNRKFREVLCKLKSLLYSNYLKQIGHEKPK
jgi:hypothetical protein